MRPALIAALTLGAAQVAMAAPPEAPRFGKIPAAELPGPLAPSAAPRFIAASERVRWLVVEGEGPIKPPRPAPKKKPAPSNQRDTPPGGNLEADPQQARPGVDELDEPAAPKATPKLAGGALPPRAAFEEAHVRARGAGCLRIALENRDQLAQPALVIPQREGVIPVQLERVSYAGDEARLEVAQAWLDARTLGVRSISSTKAPLLRLLPTQHGVDVWGVRERGGLRVVASMAPSAVGAQRDQYSAEVCSTASIFLRDTPGGQQETTSFTRQVWQPAPGRPALAAQPRVFALTASLSRLSRDPEPLLSVGLRLAPRPQPAEPGVDLDLAGLPGVEGVA